MPPKMSPALEQITISRISMILSQPFFGALAMRLELIETNEELAKKLTTAAVDGRHMWFNPAFIKTLTKDETTFLVAHEVLHCVFDHMNRRYDRNPEIWNMAADYVINATLIEAGFKMPKIGLYDKKYFNWTTEDVYDDLVKNGEKGKKGGYGLDIHPGDPGFPGGNKKGSGKGDEDGEGGGGDGDEDGEGDGEGGLGEGLSAEERRALADEWKDAVIQAAQLAAGSIPAGLKRLLDDITDPQMDWRQILQMHLQSCVRTDYTWMRPNKRTFGQGITMPSMDLDDMVKVCIAIDTSGSVSEAQLKDFLGEIKGVMDAFSGYEIHIACFDAELYEASYMLVSEEDDLMTYVSEHMQGGGGTDFMTWWNWAKDQDWIDEVQKCIFFTDGYPFGEWGIEDLIDTIWVIHGSKNEGPFGTTVFYEEEKNSN